MNKKQYNQPLIEAIESGSCEILAGSEYTEPQSLRMRDEEVQGEPQGSVPPNIWGTQW